MKFNLTLVTGLLFCGSLFAQTPGTSGSIVFEEKIKFEFNFGGVPPPMMDSLPKEIKTKKAIIFTPDASLYSKYKTDKEIEPEPLTCGSGGGGMKIMIEEPDQIVYSDLKEMRITEQKEFMSRNFLITSDLGRFQWKLTGKQKMIGNYPCQEAMGTDTSKKVTAWFTTLVPVSSGPAGYGNLPGMIMELILDEGDRIITAKTVDIKDIDKKLLVKPKKGKKVTREEYKVIVDEKMKEMGEGGGGHQIMIRGCR